MPSNKHARRLLVAALLLALTGIAGAPDSVILLALVLALAAVTVDLAGTHPETKD